MIMKRMNMEKTEYKKEENKLEDYEQYVKYLYGFNINDDIKKMKMISHYLSYLKK